MNILPADDTTAGRMVGYIKSPFTQRIDIANWLLFGAFVVVVAFLWNNVLRHVVAE
jgi:hypothetical protein